MTSKIEPPFRRFYEELLVMLGDAPLTTVLGRIDRACPEPETQRVLLGHLQDSLQDLQRQDRDRDPRAVALEELIAAMAARLDRERR